MKTTIPFLTAALWASFVVGADSSPKEALLSASKKLGEKPNYSWKTTVAAQGDPTGTIEGRTEKGGATFLALARGDQAFDAVLRGSKGALKTEEGWTSLAEAAAEDSGQSGRNRFVARLVQNLKAPAAEVADLAGKVKDLKEVEGVYNGALGEEAAKELLLFRTQAGGDGPDFSNARGLVKFWLKDGAIAKYELTLHGTLSANGNDREVNRTHTTEIKDVGTTKVSVPDEAAKRL